MRGIGNKLVYKLEVEKNKNVKRSIFNDFLSKNTIIYQATSEMTAPLATTYLAQSRPT